MTAFLNKLAVYLNGMLMAVGGVVLVAMILLTCTNIVARTFWMPVKGTFELMGFGGAMLAAFALGGTQMKRSHIAVDVLINTFGNGAKRFLEILNNGICLLFFLLVTWQVALKGAAIMRSGEVTETLRMIYYPFVFAVAIGCGALTLVFLVDLMKSLWGTKGDDR